MTEKQWLRCADPRRMLEFVQPGASDRKLRLFACLCARVLWEQVPDNRNREAVSSAELHAEGLIGDAELKAAYDQSQQVVEAFVADQEFEQAWVAAVCTQTARVPMRRPPYWTGNRRRAGDQREPCRWRH